MDRVPTNRIARKTGRCFTVDLTSLGLTRQVYAERNSLCYNSFTGQGQLLWVGVACTTVFDSGLAWCPWCPLTSRFGSMGLKQATQAKRLNLRKASKYAGFRQR